MNVVTGSKVVITDSDGLQDETTYLWIPCRTMRQNTEKPITSTQGTNRLVRVDNLAQNLAKVMAGDWPQGICPPLWGGKIASPAVESLRRRLQQKANPAGSRLLGVIWKIRLPASRAIAYRS
jgi:UDP-N-acetylglucosamine 2-epimerase (non-hydrolysing)